MGAVLKLLLLGTVCLAGLVGCGDGLGECDPSMLGGSMTGVGAPHDGQAVIAGSCASGRCHSEAAEGRQRVGAPAGLNFDVVAVNGSLEELGKMRRNAATVVDWAEDMWNEVEGGSMPPPPPAGGGELSSADKEKVRNWLACGAPLVEPDANNTAATWDSIWAELASDCVGCHNTTQGPSTGMGFTLGNLGDACTSYNNIVGAAAVTPMCGASPMTVVAPGNPDGSLLMQKLTATQTCGDPMPPFFEGGLSDVKPELVDRIRTWIMNNAPKPLGCP